MSRWSSFLKPVLGEFHYSPPPWLRNLSGTVRTHPGRWAASLVLLAVLGGAGIKGWRWWEAHRPRERQLTEVREVTAKITAPAITEIVKGRAVVGSIMLTFSKPTAKLELVGKPVPQGVTLSPAHAGVWRWLNDKQLVFAPLADWPAGTAFSVTLDRSLLAKEVKLDTTRWDITTPALTPTVQSFEFYTDPQDPEMHQVVATIGFSHPMKLADVLQHVKLEVIGQTPLFNWGGAAPASLFTVTEGKDQRQFFVRSARIVIPAKEDFVRLTLTPGLTSVLGGKATVAAVEAKVTVPDVNSGFGIKAASTEIVRTPDGDPEQFLFVDADGYATPEEIAKHVQAWLLPKDKPKTKDEEAQEDYEWKEPGEITAAVMKLSKPVKLTPVETEKDKDAPVSERHAFKFVVQGTGHLLVRVTEGVKALGGFRLADAFNTVVPVAEFPKEVQIMGKGGVLALNGERKISIKSRGAKHLRITLGRVPAMQVNHLAQFNHGDFESPQFWGDLGEENIAHFHREVREVAARNDYEAVYSVFDFSAALNKQDPADLDTSRGMFFLTVEGVEPREPDEEEQVDEEGHPIAKDPDPLMANWVSIGGNVDGDEERPASAKAKRFIMVTDLGLLVKRSADGSRDVFLQSVSKGEPLANVPTAVMTKNGEFLAIANTDADGHVHYPSFEAFQREKSPVAISARVGNDLAFIPFNKPDRVLDFSRFDTAGVNSSEKESLDAFLFTERGVYRPGDTVHVAGMVRRRDWGGELADLPLKLTVYDAKDEETKTYRFALPADGYFDWELATGEAEPTGQYKIKLSLVKEVEEEGGKSIGRTAFRLEDFQPDRMKVNVALNTAPGLAWVQPHDVKATVKVETLFGFAAAQRRVLAKMELSPAEFAFEQYPDYTFHNRGALKLDDKEEGSEDEESTAGKKVSLGELKTDDAGKAEFDLGLQRFEGGSFKLSLAVEAFEAEGGRSVQAGQSMLVAPMPYVVGYKADGPLAYIGKDTQRALKLICLGPDLKPLAAPGLTTRIVRIRHVSVLTKQESGSYAYVSTRRESTANETAFTLPAEGALQALPTQEPGEWRYELRDSEGHVVCATPFTVVGKGSGDRNLERDAELELKLARSTWNSGDQLELSFTAPYTGAGLITIERENVRAWKWFKSPTPSSTQQILVPPGLDGTGYVSVAFVRGLDSPEVFMSPLSYAVKHFTANPDLHRLAVQVDAPKLVKPGQVLKIGYTTAQPGRVVVYAVDEGIHQITNYKLPQPLDVFARKRSLETQTHQLLDLILPEFSLLSKKAFGGDEDDGLKVNLNPFKRRKEAPVVFWSGIVESGPQRREVSYAVPDYFDGRLKIMAVALAAEKTGAAETQSLVRGPFVLTPNVPTFASPGDEFSVSLTVANNLEGANAPSTVALSTTASEQLEMVDPADFNLEVAPGKEASKSVRLRTKAVLGGAEIAFKASAGGQSVERHATLSVRPSAPYLTEVKSGYFRQPKLDVKLDRDVYPAFRKGEAMVSALPIGLARGLEAYLREYPHGCSEQITSRAMSRLLLSSEVDFGFDQAESASQLEGALRLLVSRQTSNGGFSYWAGDGTANPLQDFLSVYVMHFLIEAKDVPYELPDGLLERTSKRMTAIARTEVHSVLEADIQAASIYLLTRNGEVTTNYLLNLRDTLENKVKGEWRSSLAAAYMGGTYAMLKKTKEGESLMRSWWSSADKAPKLEPWRYDYYNDPKVKQAQGFALLCRHFPDIAKGVGFDELKMITDPINANRFNTLSAAYSILALKAYSKLVAQSDVKLAISSLTTAEPRLLMPQGAGMRRAPFPAGLTGLRFQLDKGNTDLGAFYQVLESGFDKGVPTQVIADGLEVTRELLGKDGKVVTSLKVGESATVRLRIRNNSPEALNNVALLDLMPGGFELEPNGLKPGRGTPGADSVDVREDRNVFYLSLSKAESRTFSYGIKPVCPGKFTLPPVFAESMYDRGIKGRSGGGVIVVE